MSSRMSDVEVNFVRLMNACKRLSADVSKHNFWRLRAYVKHMQQLYMTLDTEHKNTIHDDVMVQYRRELMFLKGILDAEDSATLQQKVKAAALVPTQPQVTPEQNIAKKHAQARYNAEMRRELMGEQDGLRLRNAGDEIESTSADMNAVLKHHHDVQEKLAQQFLQLTTSLKQNVTVAGHVVRTDNQTAARIQTTVAKNKTNLDKESARVEKYAYRSWFDCGIYCVLLMVIISFIGIVLMMRLFPKPRPS